MNDPTVAVVSRSGRRQPLDRATGFELWDTSGHRRTLPGELVLPLVMHHLRSLSLTEHLRMRLATPPPAGPPVIEVRRIPPQRAAPRLRHSEGRRLRGRAAD